MTTIPDIKPGAPLILTGNRQQDRRMKRIQEELEAKIREVIHNAMPAGELPEDPEEAKKQQAQQMKKELEEDGLADSMSAELNALEKALEMDKEKFLRLKKSEIIPFIEEELATRYWFQEAGIQVRLR